MRVPHEATLPVNHKCVVLFGKVEKCFAGKKKKEGEEKERESQNKPFALEKYSNTRLRQPCSPGVNAVRLAGWTPLTWWQPTCLCQIFFFFFFLMLEFTSATRVTDLASRSQSYPTVTLSRQQSSGLLATTESKREAERQQVIMETKRGGKKRDESDERGKEENERRQFCWKQVGFVMKMSPI